LRFAWRIEQLYAGGFEPRAKRVALACFDPERQVMQMLGRTVIKVAGDAAAGLECERVLHARGA
jgi:hypothetical protein